MLGPRKPFEAGNKIYVASGGYGQVCEARPRRRRVRDERRLLLQLISAPGILGSSRLRIVRLGAQCRHIQYAEAERAKRQEEHRTSGCSEQCR